MIVRPVRPATAWERMPKVRVLLADDHEPVLARVRSVLGDEFEIVGEVTNGRDAVKEVQRLDPDVLVIDISMPVLDGLQAVSNLQSTCRRQRGRGLSRGRHLERWRSHYQCDRWSQHCAH